MITNVYSTGSYVTVSSAVGGPYVNASNPSAGMMRYHNQQVQVYDGSSWLAMGSAVNIGLTGEAGEILNWAREKMQQEKEARAMAEQYPAVADALNSVWEAEQQLKTVVTLCRT